MRDNRTPEEMYEDFSAAISPKSNYMIWIDDKKWELRRFFASNSGPLSDGVYQRFSYDLSSNNFTEYNNINSNNKILTPKIKEIIKLVILRDLGILI